MAITRLSGGTSPANGSDPRTFPAIWNDAVDDIEAAEAAIGVIEANDWVTTARIDDGAVTAPKLANTAGAVMVFADAAARSAAIPTPAEGMITYLSDTNAVEKYDGAAFVNVDTGKILQVVHEVKTDAFTAAGVSATKYELTGLTASITPTSATSKILIHVVVSHGTQFGGAIYVTGGTNIAVGDAAGSRGRAPASNTANGGNYVAATSGFFVLDSPATTSTKTYGLEVTSGWTDTRPIYVNRGGGDNDAAYSVRTPSSITLMEIAG